MELDRIFSVSEFNEAISFHLGLLGEVVVEGEISQLKVSMGKFVFLTLKDSGAATEVFSMAFQIRNLYALEEGMQVKVYGVPKLHQKSGRFSLNAHHILPSGEGSLKLAFEKIKQKLELEGLFDQGRKRPLPSFPSKIGLITAKGSDAYNDFVKVLKARFGGVQIHFYPVQVQGVEAVDSILEAINYFNRQDSLDLIVITRGGGSLEDLSVFNDERLVRAVFASRQPVVSGIGHEKNESLVDLVADLRASTPSNAAELISPDRQSLLTEQQYLLNRLEASLQQQVQFKSLDLNRLLTSLSHSLDDTHHQLTTLFANFGRHLDQSLNRINLAIQFLDQSRQTMTLQVDRIYDQHQQHFLHLQQSLEQLSHHQVLKRGYSITFGADGNPITSTTQAKTNQDITTLLSDGKITSTIKNVS
jgi:exodeoxyribonuclease VII large subunit